MIKLDKKGAESLKSKKSLDYFQSSTSAVPTLVPAV